MQSDAWNERYSASSSVWSATPNQFVVEYLSALEPASMLDVAGGEGRNALWFATRGWTAENLDFSSVAVERSQEWAERAGVTDRFVGTIADVTSDFVAQLAPVDLTVMAYLQLPHTDLKRAIRRTALQLAPGGKFFGVWHARENLSDGYGGPKDETVLPTRAELVEAAAAAGLEVELLELLPRTVTERGQQFTAIDVVLLARMV